MKRYPHKKFAIASLAAISAAALLLSGCAGADTPQKKSATEGGLILDISGPLSDPFFGATKAGSDAAAKDLGLNYQYVAGKDFTDIVNVYKKLTQAAIGRKPAAIVIGNYFPDALSPLIKQAVADGIPVVVTNSGRTTWESLGAIGFVGEDPEAMGAEAGKQSVAAGAKVGLCVNTVQGNPTLDARCAGYLGALKEAGGTGTVLQIASEDGQNNAKIQQVVAGALKANPQINDIFSLGAGPAVASIAAAKQVGRPQISIGTCDLSAAVLKSIKSGELLYSVDQQPFLQGYYGLQIAAQYLKYGVKPAGAVNTGPNVITKQNVQKVLDVASKYPGIRGAN